MVQEAMEKSAKSNQWNQPLFVATCPLVFGIEVLSFVPVLGASGRMLEAVLFVSGSEYVP